jgi:hypothetical protein
MVELGSMDRLAQFHLVLIAEVWNLTSSDLQCDAGTSCKGIWVLSKQDSISGLQLRMKSEHQLILH